MKRYFIELTALGLMALAVSCHKATGEIDSSVNGSTAEVNLSVDGLRVETSDTRATVIDMPDFSVNGFKIAGYYTSGLPYVDDANPGTSGRFEDNLATATPNVFNYESPTVSTTESVIVPPLVDGKYRVTLSRWVLVDNSYLSYFAWASNVGAGVAEGAAANPIVSSTKHGDLGAPKLTVTSGTTSQSLNVDVVASKSANNQNNVVRTSIDLDFKHIFSKLKFSVKNAAAVNATLTGAKILFTNINRTAIYTFDGTSTSPGTWGTYSNSAAASYTVSPIPSTPLAAAGAAADLGEILIIPQAAAAGAISVELTYTLPNGAGAASYTRTVPLKASKFEQNNSYNYVITIDESQISIGEGMIGAWKATETGLPNVVGARDANVLLLLDGYDPPYTHTDGTKYWLDRSGWNRHCKIVGGVSYNAAGKYYTFLDNPSTASYCEVPAFPTTTAATVDFVARSNRTNVGSSDAQCVFRFIYYDGSTEKRVMNLHFNYNGSENYYFDAGQTPSTSYTRVNDKITFYGYRRFGMYRAAKNSSTQILFRNTGYRYSTRDAVAGPQQAVNLASATDRQIGYAFVGDIKYLKVMNVAKTSMTDAATQTEFANLKKRHKFEGEDYVLRGMFADFRASNTVPAVDKLNGYTMSGLSYVSGSNAYQVGKGGSGVEGNPHRALGSVGNLTIECRFLTQETIEGWGFSFVSSSWGRGINCMVTKYQETGSSDNVDKVLIDLSPYNGSRRAGTYTFVRDQDNRQFRFYLDGVLKYTQNVSYFSNNFSTSSSVILGWPGSHGYDIATLFQSLRVYTTALTTEEVAHNWWLENNIY